MSLLQKIAFLHYVQRHADVKKNKFIKYIIYFEYYTCIYNEHCRKFSRPTDVENFGSFHQDNMSVH